MKRLLPRPTCIVASLLAFGVVSGGTAVTAFAQAVEIAGGTSSLYEAGGGSVTLHTSSIDLTAGAGTENGHLLEGTRLVKSTPRGTYIFGDNRIDFRLPTDLFDTSHYLLLRGIGFSGVRRGTDVVAFAGSGSLDWSNPFFSGVKMTSPEGVLFLKKQLAPRWWLYSDTIAAGKMTQIAGMQWIPQPKTELALCAGMGTNKPYGAASVYIEKPLFDLRAAYIAAGQQFHRITVSSPLLAEPVRENILFTFRPLNFLSLSAGHQNYLVPQYPNPNNFRSSIDQGSASLHLMGVQWNGSIYRSTYAVSPLDTESNHAVALSAMHHLNRRIDLAASYFISKPKGAGTSSSLLAILTEKLTSRIAVTEDLTYSGGHTGINFGGEFDSNLITFNASYETFYVPAENAQPFQQALLIDVKLKLFGRLMLHGASYVDPTGRIRYTADGNSVLTHTSAQAAASVEHVVLGRYLLRGCVVDDRGQRVEGAAVVIDEKTFFTDSSGCFSVRENKPRTHLLRVSLSDFLPAGSWQVASMPSTITSTAEESAAESTVTVAVRRVPVSNISSLAPPPNPVETIPMDASGAGN